MIRVYVDAEFDAVRYKNRFEQAIISIGAVISNDSKKIDEFYSLVCPKYFKKLSPVVKRITQLKNEDILTAPNLYTVIHNFMNWLSIYGKIENMEFYACGPDDKRTLLSNCKIHNIESYFIEQIQDLQKEISRCVYFQNKIVSPTLSLDDMKLIYDVKGKVIHNALTDALDLMHIHDKYLNGNLQNKQSIIDIVNRKEEKRIASRKKQIERLRKLLTEQFELYPKDFIKISLLPEVIEQFQLWENRESSAYVHWRKNSYIIDNVIYPYKDLEIWMKIDLLDELPSVHIKFKHREEESIRKYELNYKNSTMIEKIMKRVTS